MIDRKTQFRKGFKTLIPITKRFVAAPAAYDRLVKVQRIDLSAARHKPQFAIPNMGQKPGVDLTTLDKVAWIMHRIRWRKELKDDWTPARGWGDCDSKVTRGIEELLNAGWPRGSLRIVIGQVRGDPDPIWHAVLSAWSEGSLGKKCIILDPRFQNPMNVPAAAPQVWMQYIEVPGRKDKPFAMVGAMNRPRWARDIKAPVQTRRSRVTLQDVFDQARGKS